MPRHRFKRLKQRSTTLRRSQSCLPKAGGRHGSVLTSAGKAAALDLCLHLVRLDHGSSIANTVARRLVVPPHRDGGQAQFVTTPLRRLLTQRIRRAQELPETTDDTVDVIASATGMGTAATLRRHFNRAVGVPPDSCRRTFRSPAGRL